MKKKIKLLLLIGIVLGLFTACKSKPYNDMAGTVYQKEVKEATVEKRKEKVSNGNKTVEKTYEYTLPKRYIIYVKYNVGWDEIGWNEKKTYAFFVSEDIYNSTNEGDEYYYNKVKDSIKEPYDEKKEVE